MIDLEMLEVVQEAFEHAEAFGRDEGTMRRELFKVIVADPPWAFGDKLPGKTRGAERNYKVMTTGDIECFEPDLIHRSTSPNALLFLWRVASQVEEAMRVVRAWGFVPKSEIVWVKTRKLPGKVETKAREYATRNGVMPWGDAPPLHFGMGRYVRMAHESCIVAARGKAVQLVRDHAVRSVFFAPIGAHSQKPEDFYDLVEKLTPGPYLELFARRHRSGWTCMGDELGGTPAAIVKSGGGGELR